jgi:hypothetical protein
MFCSIKTQQNSPFLEANPSKSLAGETIKDGDRSSEKDLTLKLLPALLINKITNNLPHSSSFTVSIVALEINLILAKSYKSQSYF